MLVVVLAVGEEARGKLCQRHRALPVVVLLSEGSIKDGGAQFALVLLGAPARLHGRELHDSLSPSVRVVEHEVHLPSLLDLPCLVLPLPQSDAHFRLPSAESRPLPAVHSSRAARRMRRVFPMRATPGTCSRRIAS